MFLIFIYKKYNLSAIKLLYNTRNWKKHFTMISIRNMLYLKTKHADNLSLFLSFQKIAKYVK